MIGFIVALDFGPNPVAPVIYNSAYASVASSPEHGPSFDAHGHFVANPPNALASDISVNGSVAPGAPGQLPRTPPSLPSSANGDAPAGVPTPVSLTGELIDVIKNVGAPQQVPAPTAGHVRFEIPYSWPSRPRNSPRRTSRWSTARPPPSAPGRRWSRSRRAPSRSRPPHRAPPIAPARPLRTTATRRLRCSPAISRWPRARSATCNSPPWSDYASAANIPAAANQNLAFAVSSLAANPSGGSVSGAGSSASFVPASAAQYIALDRSSGNSATMGGTAAGATVFATSGGQSGVTGPTTAPTTTVGEQQLPATPNGDNSNPPTTQATLLAEQIGLIKSAGVLRELTPKSYQVPYTLVVKNVAGVPLTNVQVMDNLLRTFNPGGTAGITIAVSGLTVGGAHDAPAGADPTCTAAAGFNGALQSALLGGSDSLLPGQKCVISFVATVSWGANPVPSAQLLNQAFAAAGASAQTPGGGNLPVVPNNPAQPPTYPASTLASVASTNAVATPGTAPGTPPPLTSLPPIDPHAAPSPTPVAIQPAYLDVVKSLKSTLVVDSQTFDVSFVLSVKNTGTLADYSVQINDYLRGTFAIPASQPPTLSNGGNGALPIAVAVSAGHCTAAANFDGSLSTGLLARRQHPAKAAESYTA